MKKEKVKGVEACKEKRNYVKRQDERNKRTESNHRGT